MKGTQTGQTMWHQLSGPLLGVEVLLRRTQQALHMTPVLRAKYLKSNGAQAEDGLCLHHPNLSPDNTGQAKSPSWRYNWYSSVK